VDHAPVGLPIPAPAGSLASATAFAHDPDLSHFITACPCSAVAGPLHDHLPAASMRCNIIECTRAIERVIGTLGYSHLNIQLQFFFNTSSCFGIDSSGVGEFSEDSADALDQRGALVHSLHVKNASNVAQSHNSVLCQRCHENYATFECRTCAFVARTQQSLPERQCRERLQNYGLNMHPHPFPLPVPSLSSMPEVQGQSDAMFRGDGDSLMCDHCFQQTHQLDDCHVRIPFHPFALCTAPVPSVIESNQFNATTVDSTGLPYLRLVSEPCVGSYWVTLDDQPTPGILFSFATLVFSTACIQLIVILQRSTLRQWFEMLPLPRVPRCWAGLATSADWTFCPRVVWISKPIRTLTGTRVVCPKRCSKQCRLWSTS
jgi:hypothetical protein